MSLKAVGCIWICVSSWKHYNLHLVRHWTIQAVKLGANKVKKKIKIIELNIQQCKPTIV